MLFFNQAGDECGADYPAECRILPWPIGRPSIRSCENAEGIFPVSYDTGLLEKETPGFSPGSFIQTAEILGFQAGITVANGNNTLLLYPRIRAVYPGGAG